jgi:carbamoyl-phosphate synthase large subunit
VLRILLTGAGAPGTWGTSKALRLNPDGMSIHIVGVDARADTVGRYILDGYYQVKSPSDPGYLDQILTLCRHERINVVVPQTSAETLYLSRHRASLTKNGIGLLAPPADAVELAENKDSVYTKCLVAGVPTPETILVKSIDELRAVAAAMGYPETPVAIKPPVSNGMRGFRVLRRDSSWTIERFFSEKPSADEITLSELEAILSTGPFRPLLVSEFLGGIEYSVDVLRTAQRVVIIPRKRTVIRSGISFVTDIEFRSDLLEASAHTAQALGLLGVFGFQFREDSSGLPKILECNPRIQGTMVASLVSGYNIIWAGICDVLGWELPALPPLNSGRFSRYWGGVGVDARGTAVVK